ncbi:acyltransferase family protein [Photobacterium makurazakiensis]|uniref:acyltransferase family protein n=1 Tax=Photobacterium makurazakiensis TaxID=2910234 RepID=UPI003D10C16F
MKRIYTFDSLKLLSILAIFFIHYGVFYYFSGIEHNQYYLSFNIAARFAVPVFFVIAGFLFYHKVQDGGWPYTKKYLGQLLLMYISWTMVYLLAFGIGRDDWRAGNLSSIFYLGTWGAEILWFLMALSISIGVLFLAVRSKQTAALLAIASVLHLVGLTGQGYQNIIAFELFNDTNNIFNQSRDPLFFALFYVTLGYHLAKPQWQDKLRKIKWQYLLVASVLFMMTSLWEGLTLIQSHGGKIADYYLSTIPLTLSLVCLAIRSPNAHKSSIISKVGTHSGEIYLNHGIIQIMQGTAFWMIGYYRVPEMMSQQANSVILQSLLAPTMFVINIGLYFTVRAIYRACISHDVIKTYRESAIILNAYWLLFFTMQTADNTSQFDANSLIVVSTAVICAVIGYCLALHAFKQIDNTIHKLIRQHITVVCSTTVCWFILGYSNALINLGGSFNPTSSAVENILNSKLLIFSLLFLVMTGITLTAQRIVYASKPRLVEIA